MITIFRENSAVACVNMDQFAGAVKNERAGIYSIFYLFYTK
jgi:hypothetical protein